MSTNFLETHYEDYIKSKMTNDLHSKITKAIEAMPNNLCNNMIFYGPPGIGKYSQALMYIKKYSPSSLTYEKKMVIAYNKESYCYKISDIHFEIDMETLGCNARLLWTEIYAHIEDVVSSRVNKEGIILCRNFHAIHSELLDTFYSYMQRNSRVQHLYFYILSESISFIPDSIINCCHNVNMSRPSITQYNKCLKTKIKSNTIVENIKELKCTYNINNKHELLASALYEHIINYNELKYTKFRDMLYDILIYDYNLGRLLFILLNKIYDTTTININDLQKRSIYYTMCNFLKNYNNNYRPIYHLELLMFTIIRIIHEF